MFLGLSEVEAFIVEIYLLNIIVLRYRIWWRIKTFPLWTMIIFCILITFFLQNVLILYVLYERRKWTR